MLQQPTSTTSSPTRICWLYEEGEKEEDWGSPLLFGSIAKPQEKRLAHLRTLFSYYTSKNVKKTNNSPGFSGGI